MYPLFDTAPKDFNFESIFTENAFSGIDRVSDGNQLTAGLTTRIIDPATGAETLRLAVVQRVRFADQRHAEGTPASRRFSDVLIAGSTTLVPQWTLAGSAQYDPDQRELARLIVGARYSPTPFRTVNVGYRQTRDPTLIGLSSQQSEQVEMGWQWPLFARRRWSSRGGRSGAAPRLLRRRLVLPGQPYTVGRVNYSLKESRVTDGVIGFEYDAGCWIGRVVFERVSTGLSEATTRVMLQLELVGLSRLGSNRSRS